MCAHSHGEFLDYNPDSIIAFRATWVTLEMFPLDRQSYNTDALLQLGSKL